MVQYTYSMGRSPYFSQLSKYDRPAPMAHRAADPDLSRFSFVSSVFVPDELKQCPTFDWFRLIKVKKQNKKNYKKRPVLLQCKAPCHDQPAQQALKPEQKQDLDLHKNIRRSLFKEKEKTTTTKKKNLWDGIDEAVERWFFVSILQSSIFLLQAILRYRPLGLAGHQPSPPNKLFNLLLLPSLGLLDGEVVEEDGKEAAVGMHLEPGEGEMLGDRLEPRKQALKISNVSSVK